MCFVHYLIDGFSFCMDVKWWFVAMTTAASQPPLVCSNHLVTSTCILSHSLTYLIQPLWLTAKFSSTLKKVKTAEIFTIWYFFSSSSLSLFSWVSPTQQEKKIVFFPSASNLSSCCTCLHFVSNNASKALSVTTSTFQTLYFVTQTTQQQTRGFPVIT